MRVDWGVQLVVEVVTLNYINDENKYTLSRSDFAKRIGKSIGAVKQDMRRGKYKDLYIFKNGTYFFRLEEEVRENYESTEVHLYPISSKKAVNRGNHFKAKYPNESFKKHNELKMLLKIKEQISEETANEFLSEYQAWQVEKTNKRQKQLQKALQSTTKNYGGPIRIQGKTGYISWSTEWKTLKKPKKSSDDIYLENNPIDPENYSKKYYW